MAAIELTEDEQELRDKIQSLLDELWKDCDNTDHRPHEDVLKDLDKLGQLGHGLHHRLAKRGFEPLHHEYMYKNRGVPVTDPEFYAHIHPAEDLLKYIDDPVANADAPDLTVGQEFQLKVYANRWGHDDTYRFKRVENGWEINAGLGYKGKCKKSGEPVLFDALRHDSVSYPRDLSYHIETIWDLGKDGATHNALQREFDYISQWLRSCEMNSPDSKDRSELEEIRRPTSNTSEGSITFLDVLGWKGIWSRDDHAIVKLEELHHLVSHWAQGEALENTKRSCGALGTSWRGANTKVLLISDTLVITTYGDATPTLWLHGEIVTQAICESLSRGLPLRGATCFGKFEISERTSVFVGPAVDEAAEWYEQLDGIGVILTPTAMLSASLSGATNSPWIEYTNPPIKSGKLSQIQACNWPVIWSKRNQGSNKSPKALLSEALKRLGPISPSVAPKIFSSLDFFDKVSAQGNKTLKKSTSNKRKPTSKTRKGKS